MTRREKSMKYIIGTRGSKLALIQADYVRGRLSEAYQSDTFEIKIISTKGDRVQDRPLNQIGDKGVFVREIEEQILSGDIHIGVHSMKDMPAHPAQGLAFTRCWEREDPRDVLVLREKSCLQDLPEHAVIGTGSVRRSAQILKLRSDLRIVNIRGNVDTRLRKMQEQKLDGIILAAAGLKRLGMEAVITQYLESEEMISAPAQGALALEVRSDAEQLREMLDALSDPQTDDMIAAERRFLSEIGGDCHVPVGAICKKSETCGYVLDVLFGRGDGSDAVYASVRGEQPEMLARQAAREIRRQMAGTVCLVGAGPGDPGLITVRGLERIREADCIVYDRLSAPELLDEAKPECEKIYVGKANRCHTMEQDQINRLLVELAMRYQKVVRLKGGDVYVFGRGGEEGLYLNEHGVPFEIVPGISSSIAGPAYAGIPVTHRGMATGFHVVTAHNKKDELADIDFRAMADGRDTGVFLMGLSKAEEITARLIEAGMAKETPAAAVSHATTAKQKTCVSTLEHLAEEIRSAGLTSPALIVVGQAVALREQLCFFERRPMFGRRYLVSKIGSPVSELTKTLRENGACVREIQTGSIQFLPGKYTREQIANVDWLLFTSKNGVHAFFSQLEGSDLDVRSLGGSRIAAIGSKTAEALKTYGIRADFIPSQYHSTSFLSEIREKLSVDDIVWYLKAANADDKIKKGLESVCRLQEIPVYENVAYTGQEQVTDEELLDCDKIVFTCGSSVERILGGRSRELYRTLDEKASCAVIGPQCAKVLERFGIRHYHMAKKATYAGLTEVL